VLDNPAVLAHLTKLKSGQRCAKAHGHCGLGKNSAPSCTL
jgi:hypothetical protein